MDGGCSWASILLSGRYESVAPTSELSLYAFETYEWVSVQCWIHPKVVECQNPFAP